MSAHLVSLEQKTRILADALPYIRGFHGKTFVIKYGGNAMTEPALKAAFGGDVAMLRLVGMNPIVVHGGGPQINELLETMGVKAVFRRGMRVTDEKTMNVVEMVLGELNQEIVGLINQYGGKAVGLNGQDAHFIHARKMLLPPVEGEMEPLDLGLVGDIEQIDADLINILTAKGYIPVVMPIGVGPNGEAYNINADLVAGKLAETLSAEKLLMLTNTPGVLDRNGRLLNSISAADIERLSQDGTVQGGMLPKMDAALHAVRHGVRSVHVVDGRVPNALLLEVLTSEGVGTTILPDDAPQFLADSRRYLEPVGGDTR
ncbi:Acetylglutamate kinase [Burkholderiales bacterium]|jgi:acetylglutamate kinase|nr:Acetylglutamate kinase [Burkholderiales bacterium]